jgi:flagellar hook-length control protein FliK
MMTRPAGATGATPIPAAAAGATPNEAAWAIGADLPSAATGADAAPFTLALLAVATAADSAGAPAAPAASIATAAPAAGAVRKAAATTPTDTAARFALAPAVVTKELVTGAVPIQPASTAQPSPAGTSLAGATHVTAETPDPQPAVPAGSNAAAKAAARSPQPAEAQALPRDVLRSLFAADAAGPRSPTVATAGVTPAVMDPAGTNPGGITTTAMRVAGATRTRAVGAAADRPAAASNSAQAKGKTKSDRATQPAASAPLPSDAGAALLATVLQWTQQQRGPAPDAHPGADAAHSEHLAEGTDIAASIAATAISASGIDAAPTGQPSARTRAPRPEVAAAMAPSGDGVAGAAPPDTGLPFVAPPGTATAEAHTGERAAAARNAIDEHPYALPSVASDTAAAAAPSGASAGVDMATALRAAGVAGTASAARAASAAPVERNLAVPVHERHWPTALATQVLILSSDKLQAATLRLTPEHLGPVEVRIDMHDTQVNVNFTAAHAETRAALEQAMPQLRSVLEGAGLTLGQASVQQQARRDSQNSGAAPRLAGAADEAPEVMAAVTRARGMIDEFA